LRKGGKLSKIGNAMMQILAIILRDLLGSSHQHA
jgi:hypothetical protein